MTQARPKVVILGAGFGGLQAAQSLARSKVHITLIDRNPYHTFVPLIYQVACGLVEPATVTYSLQTLKRRLPNINVVQTEILAVDHYQHQVTTRQGNFAYDYLVLAMGTRSRPLPMGAFPIHSLKDAVQLRQQIQTCLIRAAKVSGSVIPPGLLSFGVIGGGATGVEVAGALVELDRSLARYHRSRLRLRIYLLQSRQHLLPDLDRSLAKWTLRTLRRQGVEVFLGHKVVAVTSKTISLDSGLTLPVHTAIWATGLKPNLPNFSDSEPLAMTDRDQVAVHPTLQTSSHDRIYAIGDLAGGRDRGKYLTGVAPAALQQGVTVARNLRRQIRGRRLLRFRYLNKGRLAIIGSYAAVGKIGPVPLVGFLPWLMWLIVHLVYLPGFQNRWQVCKAWIRTYILRRPNRLVILPDREG